MTLSRRIAAEFLGTAFLLAAVVGSGIMGEKLAAGDTAMALLANTLATGVTLTTLIFTFGCGKLREGLVSGGTRPELSQAKLS